MTEKQKAKFWELVSALSPASDTDIAEARALETYVSELIADAYQEKWWKTYRAALTGLQARSQGYGPAYTAECHNCAKAAANLAHGKLVP